MAAFQSYSIAQLIGLLTGEAIGPSSFYLAHVNSAAPLSTYPYRVHCYAVGLVQSGWLRFTRNLTEHTIRAGQLMFMVPEGIHRMSASSEDFEMSSFFFTSDFLPEVQSSAFKLYDLSFFQGEAPPSGSLTQQDYQRLDINFDLLKRHVARLPSRPQPVQYLLLTALMDVQQIHQKSQHPFYPVNPRGRSAVLVDLYLKQVSQQYLIHRQVSDYAGQLAVTAKHLSETVKAQTGKPASHWIDAMVVQEAQVLLSQTSYSLSQIADYLQFSTQSAFGKFFRQKLGISPSHFRQKLNTDRLR